MCFLWKSIYTVGVKCTCAAKAPAGSAEHTQSFHWYSILYNNNNREIKRTLQSAALEHVYRVTVTAALEGLVCAACLCHDGRARCIHVRARSSNPSRTIAPVRSARARGCALVRQLRIPSWQGRRWATSNLSNETCKQRAGGNVKNETLQLRLKATAERVAKIGCRMCPPPPLNSILTSHMVSHISE